MSGVENASRRGRVVRKTAVVAVADYGYGFQDDPLRPISGKYHGYLIRAGLYWADEAS
jgi:hypothetical protein